jgi:hypothetical protein
MLYHFANCQRGQMESRTDSERLSCHSVTAKRSTFGACMPRAIARAAQCYGIFDLPIASLLGFSVRPTE